MSTEEIRAKPALFVFVEEGPGIQTKRHPDLQSAMTEAQRLASKYPGTNIHILRTFTAFRTEKPKIIQVGVDPES